jgi:RNA polymerase sigma-70 factor (ECF subfamily)
MTHFGEFDAAVDQPREFMTTRWSVVLRAADVPSAESDGAMEQLCRNYWYPLYVYVRRQGRSPHDAQDLTQEFFARMMKKKILKIADPARGRFRTFLLCSLKNFLASDWKKSQAGKRGGGVAMLSIDEHDTEQRYTNEPVESQTPEHSYAKGWASTLLDIAMEGLRRKYIESGKTKIFQTFSCCILEDSKEARYEDLAAEIGMSAGAARVAIHRMRDDFRQVLRAEVASTVESREEVDDELRYLINVLRN